ncbi:MAG: sugar transferase [Acidimicrobiia bacterium]
MRRLARPLMYLGIAAAVLGLSKVHAQVHGYDYTQSFRFGWSLAYIALLGVTAYAVGLPEISRRNSAALTSLAAAGGAATLISLVQLLVGDELLPRFVVLGAAAVLVPWYVLVSFLATDGRDRAGLRDRVVLVDGTVDVRDLRDDLEDRSEQPARLVDVVLIAEANDHGTGDEPLVDRVISSDATVLVLSDDAQAEPSIVRQAAICHEAGVRVRTLADFYEEWLAKMPVYELERTSLMFDIGELHRDRYAHTKRLLDLVVSALLVVPLVLAAAVVLAGNVVANRGSLLFVQDRVGRNGKVFRILKFRTMRTVPGVAGCNGAWTSAADARVTRFGRVLRRTHVDELPQVLNVLKGDLSFVGPRPEQPRYVAELREKIAFYDLRHLVRPGITGWAQVKYGYAGDERDAIEKLQYDFYYLRHQSIGLDLRIIGRTLRSVVGSDGR